MTVNNQNNSGGNSVYVENLYVGEKCTTKGSSLTAQTKNNKSHKRPIIIVFAISACVLIVATILFVGLNFGSEAFIAVAKLFVEIVKFFAKLF